MISYMINSISGWIGKKSKGWLQRKMVRGWPGLLVECAQSLPCRCLNRSQCSKKIPRQMNHLIFIHQIIHRPRTYLGDDIKCGNVLFLVTSWSCFTVQGTYLQQIMTVTCLLHFWENHVPSRRVQCLEIMKELDVPSVGTHCSLEIPEILWEKTTGVFYYYYWGHHQDIPHSHTFILIFVNRCHRLIERQKSD